MKFEVEVTKNEGGEYGFPECFLRESWRAVTADGLIQHWEHGPQLRIIDPDTNRAVCEEWYLNGLRHRVGGPAQTIIDELSNRIIETWCICNNEHRSDGPAVIDKQLDGRVTSEEWKYFDKTHRRGGPAVIEYDAATGKVSSEAWYVNSVLHREDGPALVYYNLETGAIEKREFWLLGEQQESLPNSVQAGPQP